MTMTPLSCAMSCVTALCSQASTACLCVDDGLKRIADSCAKQKCSFREAMAFRNITETACQTPVRDNSKRFIVMIILVVTAAGILLVTRLVYKQFFSIKGRFDSADWSILAATLLCLPSIAVNVSMARHGLGKDIWGVSAHDLITFGIYFYVVQILYPILMGLIKISLTLFYLTLFPGRIIRLLLWATVVVHALWTVAFTLVIIFQCLPVSYQEIKYDLQQPRLADGACMDLNAGGWANAALTLASDVWLLAIPLSQIWKLTLHWKKRVGATLMFLTGAGVTIVSILRLQSIRYYANTTNPTFDQFDLVWFSTIEVGVGLICTCMPAMRLVLEHIAPRVFGSGSQRVSKQLHLNHPASTFSHPQFSSTDIEASTTTASDHTKILPKLPLVKTVDIRTR